MDDDGDDDGNRSCLLNGGGVEKARSKEYDRHFY